MMASVRAVSVVSMAERGFNHNGSAADMDELATHSEMSQMARMTRMKKEDLKGSALASPEMGQDGSLA